MGCCESRDKEVRDKNTAPVDIHNSEKIPDAPES